MPPRRLCSCCWVYVEMYIHCWAINLLFLTMFNTVLKISLAACASGASQASWGSILASILYMNLCKSFPDIYLRKTMTGLQGIDKFYFSNTSFQSSYSHLYFCNRAWEFLTIHILLNVCYYPCYNCCHSNGNKVVCYKY